MKNMIAVMLLVFCLNSACYAQYPVVAENVWVPYVSNRVEIVQQVVPVTNYVAVNVPVNVPVINYYRTPVIYYAPYVIPSVRVGRFGCFQQNNYFYPPYVPFRY